jgi:hypothetical protein
MFKSPDSPNRFRIAVLYFGRNKVLVFENTSNNEVHLNNSDDHADHSVF